MPLLGRSNNIINFPGRGPKKKRKGNKPIDQSSESRNFKSKDRFEGEPVKDNVYICKQDPSLQARSVLPFCNAETQLAFDCVKVGVHYGKSNSGLSKRNSQIGVELIAANPYMVTALVESGIGICIEGIMKGLAIMCGLIANAQNSPTLVHESCPTEVSIHIIMLNNSDSSTNIFFSSF